MGGTHESIVLAYCLQPLAVATQAHNGIRSVEGTRDGHHARGYRVLESCGNLQPDPEGRYVCLPVRRNRREAPRVCELNK